MNSIPVLGIDVSKDKLDCALCIGDKYKSKVVANTRQGFADLLDWLNKWQADAPHVCMEATGIYWESSAEFFSAHGMTVSVVNPAQIKAFGSSRLTRTKTDATDARLIAEFCRRMSPEAWRPPSPAEQALRAMVQRLDALQTMRTQESNRLEVARDAVRKGISDHLAWLDKEIEALTRQIRDHINSDPDLRQRHDLLDTIPGVGDVPALGQHTEAVLRWLGCEAIQYSGAQVSRGLGILHRGRRTLSANTDALLGPKRAGRDVRILRRGDRTSRSPAANVPAPS